MKEPSRTTEVSVADEDASGTSPDLDRILKKFAISPADFKTFLEKPYDEVFTAIRAAAAGRPSYPFMAQRHHPRPKLEAMVSDVATEEQIAARRIAADRIMSLYLMHSFTLMPEQEFKRRLSISGLDHLQEAVRDKRGVILLNSHFGPGRLIPVILARMGWDLAHVSPIVEQTMLKLSLPGKVSRIALGKNFNLRVLAEIRTRLLAGEIVHSTGDGMNGNATAEYRFLGKSRPFTMSFGHLALSTGAACLPVFVRSDEFGAVRLEICPPLDLGAKNTPTPDRIAKMIDHYVDLLEQHWLADFGNVPTHSLGLFDRDYTRGSATGTS